MLFVILKIYCLFCTLVFLNWRPCGWHASAWFTFYHSLPLRSVAFFVLLLLLCGAAVGQRTARKAVARRGDGVQTLLRRYGLNSPPQQRQFRALNKAARSYEDNVVVFATLTGSSRA